MKSYDVYAGLLGYEKYIETAEFETKEEALARAREHAFRQYRVFEGGTYGFPTYRAIVEAYMNIHHIKNETELDIKAIAEIEDIYREDVESWIEYYVREAE